MIGMWKSPTGREGFITADMYMKDFGDRVVLDGEVGQDDIPDLIEWLRNRYENE